MAVVPYLLYCFVMDHPEETCKKIFKVLMILAHRENLIIFRSPRFQSLLPCGIKSAPSVGFCFGIISGDKPLITFKPTAVLLIRTYAFFNRNVYVLIFLITAISGVVSYQLYVDTSQMLCASIHLPFALSLLN